MENRQFISIAKANLRKGVEETKITKILRKEGLFDDEIADVITKAFDEYRREVEANPELAAKPNKEDRLFDSNFLEIPVSILAFLCWPFSFHPSKKMKIFSIFMLLIFIFYKTYANLFPNSAVGKVNEQEQQLREQLETLKNLQKGIY